MLSNLLLEADSHQHQSKSVAAFEVKTGKTLLTAALFGLRWSIGNVVCVRCASAFPSGEGFTFRDRGCLSRGRILSSKNDHPEGVTGTQAQTMDLKQSSKKKTSALVQIFQFP